MQIIRVSFNLYGIGLDSHIKSQKDELSVLLDLWAFPQFAPCTSLDSRHALMCNVLLITLSKKHYHKNDVMYES
jgi:hypothetical protein